MVKKTNELKTIQKEVDTFLKKLDVEAQADVLKNGDFFEINIKTKEDEAVSSILIGYHGETLAAIQLILSLIISKKIGEFVRIIVNVGDYRQKREEKLREMALEAARRVKETSQEVILGNLTPWQRRIVHMTLAQESDIETESRGEEPDRELVIKPR